MSHFDSIKCICMMLVTDAIVRFPEQNHDRRPNLSLPLSLLLSGVPKEAGPQAGPGFLPPETSPTPHQIPAVTQGSVCLSPWVKESWINAPHIMTWMILKWSVKTSLTRFILHIVWVIIDWFEEWIISNILTEFFSVEGNGKTEFDEWECLRIGKWVTKQTNIPDQY